LRETLCKASPPTAHLTPTGWQVNKAAGPFQALFCVGSFCGPDGPGELAEYVSGQACAPVATYLLDALPGAKCVTPHAQGARRCV